MSKRIDLVDLDIYYGDFLAVEGVTLTVSPRAVTSFIGPSGCGKSSVLRSINRMHELVPGAYVTGEVLLDDEDVYGPNVDPVLVRRTIGMVFQRPNPFPTMSIYDNVVAGLRLNKRRRRSAELDEVVGLSDRILVMYRGNFTGEVGPDTSRDVMGLMMAGVHYDEAVAQAAAHDLAEAADAAATEGSREA